MLVDFYVPPNGEIRRLDISNIYPEDEKFFEEHDIIVSMEHLRGDYIVYGYKRGTDPEETEQIVFDNGRCCEETLHELAGLCKLEYGLS